MAHIQFVIADIIVCEDMSVSMLALLKLVYSSKSLRACVCR